MIELNKEEIAELDVVWNLINTGRADNKEDKARAILFYNNIFGTRYKGNSNCGACLGAVYRGLQGLYLEYFKDK